MRFIFPNNVSYYGGPNHNLKAAGARARPSRVRGARRPLGGLELLGAGLPLLLRREDIHDALNRLNGAVKGGQDQVAGLGGGERSMDRTRVPHLANQDDVGVPLIFQRWQKTAYRSGPHVGRWSP